jgi:hypothetical protein
VPNAPQSPGDGQDTPLILIRSAGRLAVPGIVSHLRHLPSVSLTANTKLFAKLPTAVQLPADGHDIDASPLDTLSKRAVPGSCLAVPHTPFFSLTVNSPAEIPANSPPALQLPADAQDITVTQESPDPPPAGAETAPAIPVLAIAAHNATPAVTGMTR